MNFFEVAIIITDINLVGLHEYTHKLHKKILETDHLKKKIQIVLYSV